jgi:tetratricopeptide (TPR) repeat protein
MNAAIWIAYVALAAVSPPSARAQEPAPREILAEAGRIARRQDGHQRYWCDRTLLQIRSVQLRAGDFEGALKTMEASTYEYGRNSALVDLANALARAGQHARALAVLRQIGTDHGWNQGWLDDGVRTGCLEHEISAGEHEKARKTIDEMTTAECRADGFCRLARAYAKVGDEVTAERTFQLALAAAKTISEEFARAKALWELADAQLAAGKSPAKATIRELVQAAGFMKDPSARVAALREAAVRTAKMQDRAAADRLFRQAIDARQAIQPPVPCPEENRLGALEQIAKAQAEVGYFDDALKTARMIVHSEKDFTVDGRREEAMHAIAVAQAKAGRITDAVATALSVQYYHQFKEEALLEIVGVQLLHGDRKGATATAEQNPNPSMRAIALLKVAVAYAKLGDKDTAKSIAGRIHVVEQPLLPLPGQGPTEFDYRRPETWGCLYDAPHYFTMLSHCMAVDKAVRLAGAAMTLAQALGESHHERYAEMLKDLHWPEVLRAIARAHAANGDTREALAWASRIGSDEKLASSEGQQVTARNLHATIRVQQRIAALVGVAEGILDSRAERNGQSGQLK